jgi:hypothetical protein
MSITSMPSDTDRVTRLTSANSRKRVMGRDMLTFP